MINLSSISTFETAIERIGRLLSDNYGIKVIFVAGIAPCTDGKIILLPAFSQNADEDFLKAMAGMLDHESSHILYSNFKVFESIKDEENQNKLKSMFNLVEDVWVDKAICNEWRGCRVNLRNLNDYCFNMVKESWDKLSDWGKFIQLCSAFAVSDDDSNYIDYLLQKEPVLWQYVERIKHLLERSKTLCSSEEALALAKEILEKIYDIAYEDNQSSVISVPECLMNQYELTNKTLDKDAKISDKALIIQNQANKSIKKNKGSYLVYTTENDKIEFIKSGNRKKAASLLEESSQITNVLRSRMMRNLLAQARIQREPEKEHGKINRKSLSRLALGLSKKVFYQQVEAQGFDTRISLWVDHSGSMRGNKLKLAALSAMLFGEVLNQLKIPFEVCGFSSSTTSAEGNKIFDEASKEDKEIYTRWGGIWVGVYKSFEELWNLVKHRCSNMEENQRENTYDGECLVLAAKRLLQYPEKRKILFWFNDGEPCPNIKQFTDHHCDYLFEVAKEVEKAIEVIAIGICSDSIKDFFSDSVVVEDIEDLPKVMVGKIDQVLRRNQNSYLRKAA